MPRLGMGMPLVSAATEAAVLVIDDELWESFDSNDITINYTPTRTNLILYSQDTTQSQWVKTSTAMEDTLYADPNGGTTGNAITGAISNSTKFIHQIQSITAGETYTYSAYVKKGTLGYVRLEAYDGTTTYSADFNLDDDAAVGYETQLIRTFSTKKDGTWYQISITFQALNTIADTGQLRLYSMAANNTTTVNVASSTTVLLYVWGQQFETDIEATPYILTTTSTASVTEALIDSSRVWDFDGSNLMPEADPDSEGTWETGGELITNGTFATDANWDKSNTTISGGVAVFATSGSAKYIRQDSVVETGNSYVIKLTVVRTSGTLQILFGTGGNSVSGVSEITASGTYTFTTTPLTSTQASSGRFWAGYTSSGDNFIGTIDNVSVTEYAITPEAL